MPAGLVRRRVAVPLLFSAAGRRVVPETVGMVAGSERSASRRWRAVGSRGSDTSRNAIPLNAGFELIAISPSETMPTSRFSRFKTANRRI